MSKEKRTEPKKPKLLIVGWDAADWKIIDQLLEKGVLPTLKSLIEKGVSGKISTLDPPLSPILWTSIATGKRAYDHGIHGFTEVSSDKKTIQAVRGSSRKAKAFWEILEDYGYRSNIIGWWPSHPAEKLNGAMVSNFYGMCNTPYNEDWPFMEGTVYPPKFEEKIKSLRLHPGELTAEILRPFFPNAKHLNSSEDEVLRGVMKILAHCSSIHNATTWLMENNEWDCTAVYYDAIDHFSHLAMKYHPPKLNEISQQSFEKYSYIIEAAYRFHDMMLERLLDLSGPDTHVMIISDHGFESGKNRMISLPDEPAAPALEHRPYGVVIGSGPTFTSGKLYGSSILDFTPTVLQLFGIPVGRDMEGRVLTDMFIKPNSEQFIESHESTIKRSNESSFFSQKNDPALSLLAEIGYLNKEDLIDEKASEKVISENQFYLARSYDDGNKSLNAIELMEDLILENPKNPRYLKFLASLYLKTGDFKKFDQTLNDLEEISDSPIVHFFKGQKFMATGHYKLAHDNFKKVSNYSNHAGLLALIGQTYLKQQAIEESISYFKKSMAKDPETIEAWIGISKAYIENNDIEKALESLLDSLNYVYNNSETHSLLGLCFQKLNMDQECINALELSLKINHAQPGTIKMLSDQLLKMGLDKRAEYWSKILHELEEPRIIVSGLPRSGTSMIMQMLHKGGLDIYFDESRKADIHNPNGYFEFADMTKMKGKSQIWNESRKKVIKVTYPLIMEIPKNFRYKIIVIERDQSKVLNSQQKMRGGNELQVSFDLASSSQKMKDQCDNWLDQQPNIEMLRLNYEDVIEQSEKAALSIQAFLGINLNSIEMTKVIDPSLNRS